MPGVPGKTGSMHPDSLKLCGDVVPQIVGIDIAVPIEVCRTGADFGEVLGDVVPQIVGIGAAVVVVILGSEG